MYTIGLNNILIIDFATFLFAASALLLVKIPRPEQSAEGKRAKGSIWKEAGFGWTFIRERPGLLNLLLLFASVNLVMSMCGVAIMPMVLGFANEAAVGTIMSLVGVGTLIGGAIMTATGGPKKKIHGVLGAWAALSLWFVLVGIKPNLWTGGRRRAALVRRPADHERLQPGDLAAQDSRTTYRAGSSPCAA